MQDLTVALVQSDIKWEAPAENRSNLESMLSGQAADLIVLPEMFTTGFSMQPQPLAEGMDGETVAWMRQMAERCKGVVTGSVIIRDGGRCYNRLLWVTPQGQVDYYDKHHLFGLLGESKEYSAGTQRKVFTVSGWRVCPQICYDLRFPVWCRNQDDYDVLLFVASWPSVRQLAWNTLLAARAIENQSYVIGVNRVGRDGNNLEFAGDSQVLDPLGARLLHLENRAGISGFTLQRAELDGLRAKLPFLKDRDAFSLR